MRFFNSQTVLLKFEWHCRLLRKRYHSPMNKLSHFQQFLLHTPECYSSFEAIRIDFRFSIVLSHPACRNIPLPADKTFYRLACQYHQGSRSAFHLLVGSYTKPYGVVPNTLRAAVLISRLAWLLVAV